MKLGAGGYMGWPISGCRCEDVGTVVVGDASRPALAQGLSHCLIRNGLRGLDLHGNLLPNTPTHQHLGFLF